MWDWLKRSSNQKPLALVGGVLAAVVTAAWAAYGHFYPSQSTATSTPKFDVQAECGIAAGDDISGGNITIACGPAPEEIEALIEATVSTFDLPSLVAAVKESPTATPPEFSELRAALGVTESALREMLSGFSSVSATDDAAALAEIILANANIVPGSENNLNNKAFVNKNAKEQIVLPQKSIEGEIEPNNDIFEANHVDLGMFYKAESSNDDVDWFVFKNDRIDGFDVRLRNCGSGYPAYNFHLEIYTDEEKAVDARRTSARHDLISIKNVKDGIFFLRLKSRRKDRCNYEFRIN